MSSAYPKHQRQFNKRQIRQSILTLLLFCVALFAHSEHYSQDELDVVSTFEQHDCHLCQQGIDSPPCSVELYSVSASIIHLEKIRIIDLAIVATDYVSPLLRAPPIFL